MRKKPCARDFSQPEGFCEFAADFTWHIGKLPGWGGLVGCEVGSWAGGLVPWLRRPWKVGCASGGAAGVLYRTPAMAGSAELPA